jgi:hypothetical protein
MRLLLYIAVFTLGCNGLGQDFSRTIGFAPDPSIVFEALLLPVPSAQRASSGGGTYFSLDGDLFNGGGGFTSITPPLFAHIVDRQGALVHQAAFLGRVEGSPFGSSSLFWPHTVLTERQIGELMAGEWSVHIGLEGYSGTVIEGQIFPVPEPSTVALLTIASLAALGTLLRRPKRKTVSPR